MKTKFLIFTLLLTILAAPCQTCYAGDTDKNTGKEAYYVDESMDGIYYEISLDVISSKNVFRNIKTKIVSKTIACKNNQNETLWSFSLTGTFEYDGNTAVCISTSHSESVFDSNWHLISASSYASSNKAYGDITMRLYTLGVPIRTDNRSLQITCDKDGNIT